MEAVSLFEIHFKFQVYKKDRSQLGSTHCMVLKVNRIKRISGPPHQLVLLFQVKKYIARQNGHMPNKTPFYCIFQAHKPRRELSGIRKKKKPFAPRVLFVQQESSHSLKYVLWQEKFKQSFFLDCNVDSAVGCSLKLFRNCLATLPKGNMKAEISKLHSQSSSLLQC